MFFPDSQVLPFNSFLQVHNPIISEWIKTTLISLKNILHSQICNLKLFPTNTPFRSLFKPWKLVHSSYLESSIKIHFSFHPSSVLMICQPSPWLLQKESEWESEMKSSSLAFRSMITSLNYTGKNKSLSSKQIVWKDHIFNKIITRKLMLSRVVPSFWDWNYWLRRWNVKCGKNGMHFK